MKSPSYPLQEAEQVVVNSTRRDVVALAIVPLLLSGIVSRAIAADAACFELESLPSNQKRMRRSLGFRLAAMEDQKRCGSCSFFAVSAGDCGTCAILSGGVTSIAYVCDSWAAKS